MHQLSEINKDVILALLLAIASGTLAGIILQLINDIFSQIENQPATSIASRVKSYAHASFMFGIPMGIIAGVGLIFNTDTPIKNVRQFIVPFAIIGAPLIALTTKLLVNFLFKKQDN